jgi:hypothetical protein
MPSRLLSEWIAFFRIEQEEMEKGNLEQRAKMGAETQMSQHKVRRMKK